MFSGSKTKQEEEMKREERSRDYAVIIVIATITLLVALTICRVMNNNDYEVMAAEYPSMVAPDSVKFALAYHGIAYAYQNDKGEYVFYRNDKECKLFNSGVERAWNRRKTFLY